MRKGIYDESLKCTYCESLRQIHVPIQDYLLMCYMTLKPVNVSNFGNKIYMLRYRISLAF